jgi:trimeric autotransporter adhesin
LKYADVDFLSEAFMKKLLRSIPLLVLAVLTACGGTSSSNPGGGGSGTPTLRSIQVTAPNLSILTSATDQFTATGTFSGSGGTQNLTSTATWSSSNTAVATISAGGLVTAASQGTTTITATKGSVSGSVTLTVTATLVSLIVTPPTASIAPGTMQPFKAVGTYSDSSTKDITSTVTWTSSNTAAATISNGVSTQGLATAVAHGSSTITATSGSISNTAALTVTNGVLQSIVVTPANSTLTLGSVKQFTATGTFLDGTTSSTQDITNVSTWNSSSVSVGTVTISGAVTGLKVGTTTITATWNSISGSTQLTVNAANLSSIAIQPGNSTIALNTTIQYTAIGTFSDGSTRNITNQVTWASSSTGVASIQNSTAAAVSPGQSTISATLNAVSGSVTLVVSDATISSISVTPSGRSIAAGTQLPFIATGSFSDSSTQTITNNVTWSSSSTTFATVSNTAGSKGIVSAVSPGTTNIKATFGGVSGSSSLTVNTATLTSIALTPTTFVLAPASSKQYDAIGHYSDGTTVNINTVATWTSSATTIATVTSFGAVTGQSAGTADITAKMGSVTSNAASLIVSASPLVSLAVTPGTASVPETIEFAFTAIGTFGDGSTQDLTGAVAWTATPASVATISNVGGTNGVATGVSAGSANIAAVFAAQEGTATLNVTNATLTSIAITPNNPHIGAGGTEQFIATGTFSDGTTQVVTGQVTWTSSDVSIAVINASGLASSTGKSGTATIKAVLNSVNDTTVLSVP